MQIPKQDNNPFIFTDNKETAEELSKLGYPLLSSNNTSFLFLNTNLKNFSNEDMNKKSMKYTNRICLEGR